MGYYTDDYTEEELKKLENSLSKIYKQGAKEAKQKAANYWNGWDEVVDGKTVHRNGFYERYSKEFQAYQDGAYTKEQWQAWVDTQTKRGSSLEEFASDLSTRIGELNEDSASTINGQTPRVYAENANFEGFLMEQDYASYSSFRLVDENTISELAKGNNHSEFKVLSTNPVRDYDWNFKKIQNGLTQGLLQGENLAEITNRFLAVMGQNRNAAIRNARTAITSAQAAGRMNAFEQAKADGLTVMKEWRSVVDARTRDSHLHLHGVVVELEEEFPNGCRYPADPSGAPAEVYNCRCTVVRARKKSDSTSGNTVKTYEDWKNGKQEQIINTANEQETQVSTNISHITGSLGADAAKIAQDLIDNPAVSEKKETIKKLFEKYQKDTNIIGKNDKRGYFSPFENGIHFDEASIMGNSYKTKGNTLYHELSHNIDYLMNGKNGIAYLSNTEYNGQNILDVIKSDYKAFKKSMGAKSNNELLIALRAEDAAKDLKTVGSASDILEKCTNTGYPLGIGHGVSYHKRYGATEKEFMAEVVSDAITNEASYRYLQRIFPNAVDMLWKMIEEKL